MDLFYLQKHTTPACKTPKMSKGKQSKEGLLMNVLAKMNEIQHDIKEIKSMYIVLNTNVFVNILIISRSHFTKQNS